MTEKEMVALNNERRQQLTKENKAYYEDMLVYLRTSRIPAIKTEELLLEMLDHLLAAQKEGKGRKTCSVRTQKPIVRKLSRRWVGGRSV